MNARQRRVKRRAYQRTCADMRQVYRQFEGHPNLEAFAQAQRAWLAQAEEVRLYLLDRAIHRAMEHTWCTTRALFSASDAKHYET